MNFHEKQRNLFLFCAVEQAERAVFWPNPALNQVNRINTATLKVILFNLTLLAHTKPKIYYRFIRTKCLLVTHAHSKLCCSKIK
jgi:hypothetical protein